MEGGTNDRLCWKHREADIEEQLFQAVLFTAKNAQLVVMCLQRGEEIGDEVHRK